MLRHQAKGYVLGVSGAHPFSSWIGKPEVVGTAEEIAEELDESAWQRLSAGAGTTGERLYGLIANSLTWKRTRTTRASQGCGPGVF